MHTSRRDPHVKEKHCSLHHPHVSSTSSHDSCSLLACSNASSASKKNIPFAWQPNARCRTLTSTFLQSAFLASNSPSCQFQSFPPIILRPFVLLACQRRRMALACLVSPDIPSPHSPHVVPFVRTCMHASAGYGGSVERSCLLMISPESTTKGGDRRYKCVLLPP